MVANAGQSSGGPAVTDNTQQQVVHLILVPLDVAVGEVIDGTVTAAGLGLVAQHVGLAAPTDVVVFAGRPWHAVNGELMGHPEVHQNAPETVLQLSIGRQQNAVWWSEDRFDITGVEFAHHGAPGASASSSVEAFPFRAPLATRVEKDLNGRDIFVARSTVPLPESVDKTYKITFTMDGEVIDPDMHCSP